MAETKFTIDATQALATLDKIDAELAGLQDKIAQINGETKKAFSVTPIKEYQDQVAKDSAALDELKKDINAVEDAAKKAGKTQIIGADALKNIQVGGKSLGEYADSAQNAASTVSQTAASTNKLSLAKKALSLIIKATPIGLLIGLVASVIAYFTKFQGGIDKVSQVTAGFSAVVDVLINRFLKLGSAIVNVFSGNFSQAFDDLKGSVSGLGDELVRAATSAAAIEREFQAIRDAALTSSVTISRQRVELEKLRNVAEDDTQGTGRRIRALQAAGKIERQIAEEGFDIALRRQQNTEKEFLLNTENQAAKEAAAKASEELQEAEIALNNAAFNSAQKIRELRKQASDERKKQLDKEIQDLERLAKALELLRVAAAPEGLDSELAAVNKKYDDLAKVAADGVAKLREIESKRGLTNEQQGQLDEFAKLSVQIEENRLTALTNVLTEFNEKEISLNEEQAKRKKELAERILAGDIKALEQQRGLRDQEIAIAEEKAKKFIAVAKANGASEQEIGELQKEFDLQVQKARLQNQLNFQEQLLAIVGTSDAAQAESIKKNIELIKSQLATLEVPAGEGKKRDIWSILGIDTSSEEGEAFARQVEDMAVRVVAAFQQMAQARTDLAQQEVDESDERLSKLETDLNTEIALAQAGFASDVTLKRKEIEEEKKRNAAVKAELEKAKKSQLAIDTAIQASSLITSIANLFKSLSGIPFGAGIPIAIALSGLMIGFFIKSKVDAAKAAKARYGASGFIGDSGIVKGRTHAQGGELLEVERGEMVQVGDDGTRRRVEVVRRERVSKYMDLLKVVNSGSREEIVVQALKLVATGSMPRSMKDRILQAVGLSKESHKSSTTKLDANSTSIRSEDRSEILSQLLTNEESRSSTIKQDDRTEIAKQVFRLVEIESLSTAMQNKIFSQIAHIDTSTHFVNQPAIRQNKVTSLVFGKDKTAINVRIEGSDSQRTNELLEALIREVTRQGKAEKWSPDGKTKIVGNTKTRYT